MSRSLAVRCGVICLILGICCALPARAQQAQDAPPIPSVATGQEPLAPPPQAEAPAPNPQPVYGQLMVRMGLPPGALTAGLFLNNTFMGWMPGGMLQAPLWLLPGGYEVRVTAPALRSYQTTIQVAPGQLTEVQGVLMPETPMGVPPLAGTALPPPVRIQQRRSWSSVYKGVIWGIGITALSAVVVVGVTAAVVCGIGKCSSSSSGSHHSDWD